MTARITFVPLPRTVRLPGEAPPRLEPPAALAHPTPARSATFELSARRVRVVVSGTRGVARLEADGAPLLAGLGIAGATGANLLAGPRTARRECFAGGGSVAETVQIPEALPGCVVQWIVGDAAPGVAPELVITAELLPPETPTGRPGASDTGSPARVHAAPGLLWASRGERGVLLHVPECTSVPRVEDADGRLVLSWRIEGLGAASPATLLAQSAPVDGPWTSLKALAGTRAHHVRGESASAGSDDDGVSVETGVPELDMGVRWARAWMRDRLRVVPGGRADSHPLPAPIGAVDLVPGLGTLAGALRDAGWVGADAAGAWFAAGAAASGDRDAGRGAFPSNGPGADRPPLAAWAMALARWTAWTGETAPLADHMDLLLALFGGGAPGAVVPAGWRDPLSRAVASAAEAAELPELVQAAGAGLPEAGEAGSSPGEARRLPVVGRGAPPAPALLVPGRGGLPVRTRLAEALALREALGGLARSPEAAALGASPLLLLALVEGMLGAVPDAVFERLTLSPLLPPHWTRFSAPGIRCGEGGLALAYERDGGRVRWTLRPQLGSVPLMAIFEPWQPLALVRSVTVDGAPAELDQHPEDGWTRVSLQVPVDGVRVVEVEGEPLSLP